MLLLLLHGNDDRTTDEIVVMVSFTFYSSSSSSVNAGELGGNFIISIHGLVSAEAFPPTKSENIHLLVDFFIAKEFHPQMRRRDVSHKQESCIE